VLTHHRRGRVGGLAGFFTQCSIVGTQDRVFRGGKRVDVGADLSVLALVLRAAAITVRFALI